MCVGIEDGRRVCVWGLRVEGWREVKVQEGESKRKSWYKL